jgi:hypothetical protein
MRKASKSAVFCALSAIALGLFGLRAAHAQSAPVTTSDFDIAGVKLGMTVDQAVAALQAFGPHYTIIKNYWQNDFTSFGQTGTPKDHLNQGDLKPSFAFLTDLVAEEGTYPCPYGATPDQPCSDKPYDTVHLWFSPVIGQERVIGIQRANSFYIGNGQNYGDTSKEPATSAVMAALTKKYSIPSYSQTASNFPEYDWVFDAKGRLISPARASELHLSTQFGAGFPSSVSSGDGVTLSVVLTTAAGPTLVQQIDSSLFDGDALYNSVAQGHDTYESQEAKMNAQDAASAAKNGNSPNL